MTAAAGPDGAAGPGPGGVSWDPALYLRRAGERGRPFADLVARVGATAPRHVVDLGCGPGNLTATLRERWPGARVSAIDSSPDMVAAARAVGVDASLGDVVAWTPAPDHDVVLSNAVLQWVPGHLDVACRWVAALAPGAWLAFQVPGNFAAPSHATIRELAASPRWRARLDGVLRGPDTVHDPVDYAAALGAARAGVTVDAWETTYAHRLTGDDAVLTWVSGTALRPVRTALDDDGWAAFTADLAPLLRAAYPVAADGATWFPFRRIFVVAHCP